MSHNENIVSANFFNISDARKLNDLSEKITLQRLTELESSSPLTSFTKETLMKTHAYLFGDVYPWAGTIRTGEVGAMGLAMCRSTYVAQELDRLFQQIKKNPPSTTNQEEALRTVAEHWGELTIIHPFLDGNSRTQRYFFDQMLRHAGWSIDWNKVDAAEVHAARYVAAVTMDSSFLADALRPGISAANNADVGSLTETQGKRPAKQSAVLFHQMMEFRHTHPGESFHEHLHKEQTLPKGIDTSILDSCGIDPMSINLGTGSSTINSSETHSNPSSSSGSRLSRSR